MTTYELDELLADMPAKFGAYELAQFLSIGMDRFYCRRTLQLSGKAPNTLPQPLNLGGKAPLYSRAGLREWLIIQAGKGKPGRPLGSKSRRGIGRAALEGRSI